MLKLGRLGAIAAACGFALSTSSINTFVDGEVAPNTEGMHDGYFYQWKITSPNENATFTNNPGGSFSVNWGTNAGLIRAGKGWKVGSFNRSIELFVDNAWNGNAWAGVYGRTTSPSAQYYILDRFGILNPGSAGAFKGFYEVNGTKYSIYDQTVALGGFPDEEPSQRTVWAINASPHRTKGVVDVGAHVKAWRDAGVTLGEVHGVQLVVQEAYFSSGRCTMQFSEVP